ncbi:MAG TPA: CDP-alcohol phosphatidyltransferase family protein [Calditrichia bacterium]|nr:CDP-alcohol phosphatidyltransferase family protein [Calditrichota bacterium]HQU72898.1 CDP-alcohol phosphatidyltransferase family protein [Calditrichia bacterium]HQV33082.1 CDP-alcohol phosphatidyltransferase family protein [Calditrichia bacterium]
MSKKGFSILPQGIKDWFVNLIAPPVDFIVKHNVHPNFFTVLGILITVVAAYYYTIDNLLLGGVFVLLGGICDIVDGKVARQSGLSSKFGALFDSTLDRYSEFIMFFGVGTHFARTEEPVATLTTIITFLALGGSMMVSYVRARAEGLGFECKVGIMQRPERIVYIGFASMFHQYALIAVLWAIAILANFTAAQRMYHVWKAEQAEIRRQDKSAGL